MASSSGNLNNAALGLELETECPICLQPFDPPVYQCNYGHVVCHNCLPQCTECSICRQPMPREKVRNLQFEKMLVCIANASANIPCPRQGDGCNVTLKSNRVEKHLQEECAFVPRLLCLRISVPGACTKEYCTGKMSQLIEHLVNDHKMIGLVDEGDNQAISSTLELPGTFGMWVLDYRILSPNFISFDNKMFFIKKYFIAYEELLGIVVCMNEPLKIARNYSALVQLIPTGEGVSTSTVLEFEQKEIVLLTDEDEPICINPNREFKYHHVELCKVRFATFAHYDRTIGGGRKLNYRATVTIFKTTESC